jgi:hypothetical protein
MSDRPWNDKFSPKDKTDIEDLIEYYRRDMNNEMKLSVEICGTRMTAKIVAIPEADQITLQLFPPSKSGTIIF